MSYTCTHSTHTEPLVQSNYQHCIWLGTFICNNEEIKCKLVFPVNSQSDLSIVRGGGVGKNGEFGKWNPVCQFCTTSYLS